MRNSHLHLVFLWFKHVFIGFKHFGHILSSLGQFGALLQDHMPLIRRVLQPSLSTVSAWTCLGKHTELFIKRAMKESQKFDISHGTQESGEQPIIIHTITYSTNSSRPNTSV